MATGIYLHLPFCAVHCAYCPFAIATDLSLEDRYAAALIHEIEARAAGEAAATLCLGGGTPSRMSAANLTAIVDAARARLRLDAGAEVTLEANPEDVSEAALGTWRALGMNRLSIGVQSFNDAELTAIGRIHDAAAARAAVRLAVAHGFRTSLDLILGLPRQTPASFLATLDEALATGVGHLSLYMLDLDETTPLQIQVARGRTAVPGDEEVAALYATAVERIAAAGLMQYEISNFARPGEESRHNLRYWMREPYAGFGMGAHSFDGERRFANTRNIRQYIDFWQRPGARASEAPLELSEILGPGEQKRETLFLRLRQTRGIDYEEMAALCGTEGIEWISRGLEDGWLRRDGQRVGFTASGFLLSNEYISQLF